MSTLKNYLKSIRHYTLPGTRALKQQLDAVRESHASVSAELEKVRQDLRHSHEDDTRQLADLQAQIKQIEAERTDAHHQIELLERSVAHAEQRQKFTEAHIATLEANLEEERTRHEESLRATETRQAHMQAEQQSQLTRQTELANTFHRVSTRLFESLQEQNSKRQYSLLQFIIIAVMLFASGALVGVFALQGQQDSRQELAAVARDLGDLRGFMKQHIDNQDTLLKELSQAVNNQFPDEQPRVVEVSTATEAVTPTVAAPPQERAGFTPDIRELQAGLLALGFDLGMAKPDGEAGIKTRQALQEFRQFYLPQEEAQDAQISESLVAQILQSADRVRADAARFSVDREALAAIRLGSIRTGVDFSFLMELARIESNFDPVARAPKSSATGLYQFRDAPWLEAIRTFGAAYGLQDATAEAALIDAGVPAKQSIVKDPLQLEVLALRLNPRLTTLLMAENIKRNLQTLTASIGREPGRTDLYLAHYFGRSEAVLFLETLDTAPATIAAERFPEAAARNPGVFLNRSQHPRTVAELYRWFDSKFNTGRYDERNPV
jgi:peptidoglycan hydrolase-like protein with peptidoglycan-binding domain